MIIIMYEQLAIRKGSNTEFVTTSIGLLPNVSYPYSGIKTEGNAVNQTFFVKAGPIKK